MLSRLVCQRQRTGISCRYRMTAYHIRSQQFKEHRHYLRVIRFIQCTKVQGAFGPSVRKQLSVDSRQGRRILRAGPFSRAQGSIGGVTHSVEVELAGELCDIEVAAMAMVEDSGRREISLVALCLPKRPSVIRVLNTWPI